MKNLILILALFICSKNFGQSKYSYKQGYKFIKNAETAIKAGNLERAERNLEKAGNSNYGFCGNAWASAESQINLLKVEIYNQRKEFDKSFSVLDSIKGCGFGADCEARDSLKIVTLFLKFGKEKVKQSFKNVKSLDIKKIEFEPFYSVYLADLNYTFIFQDWDYTYFGDENKNLKNDEDIFIKLIEKHNYYKLLE
ncbi:hypothetical protein [Flavobacterium mekongense]|uniref:hypothetical protein n=1 Tax=Flavobacterium mekongense TaxID=3379707 RepID=UPI00399C0D17